MEADAYPTLARRGFQLPPGIIRSPSDGEVERRLRRIRREASYLSPGHTFRRTRNIVFGDPGVVKDPLFAKTVWILNPAQTGFVDQSALHLGPATVTAAVINNTLPYSAAVPMTFAFPGSAGQQISVPNSSPFNASFCWEVVYARNNIAGSQTFLGMQDGTNQGQLFQSVSTTNAQVTVENSVPTSVANPSTGNILTFNTYYHVAVNMVAGTPGALTVWFQGVNIFSNVLQNTFTAYAAELIWCLGARGDTLATPLQGWVAGVRFTTASRYTQPFTPPPLPFPTH